MNYIMIGITALLTSITISNDETKDRIQANLAKFHLETPVLAIICKNV